jgi:hypothetical protein
MQAGRGGRIEIGPVHNGLFSDIRTLSGIVPVRDLHLAQIEQQPASTR